MILTFGHTGLSSVEPDQIVPEDTVWSGPSLFAIQAASLGCIKVWFNLEIYF